MSLFGNILTFSHVTLNKNKWNLYEKQNSFTVKTYFDNFVVVPRKKQQKFLKKFFFKQKNSDIKKHNQTIFEGWLAEAFMYKL